MQALLRLVVVLSFLSWFPAVEESERERLHDELSSALSELAAAQGRLNDQAGTAKVVVPPAIPAQIATRRTLAAEWLRRIGTPASDFPVEEADAFREGLYALRGRLDQTANWLEIMASLGERWQGVSTSKEFERYRVFVRGAVDQQLAGIVSGEEQAFDEGLLYRRQHRHEVIMNLVEAEAQTVERLAKLPPTAPIVNEFREHRASVRVAAEAGLQAADPADDRAFDQAQQILWLLDELVSLAQEREERLAGRERPPGAAVLTALTACQQGEEQALRTIIAHVRTASDEPAWHRKNEALRAVRETCRRLTGLSAEWLNLDDSIHEVRQRVQEQVAQSPPTLKDLATKRIAALETAYGDATKAVAKAVADGNRVETVRAKATLRLVHQDHETLVQDLEFERERLNQDNDVQSRVGDASAPAVKKQLDPLWAALITARVRQQDAERAVIASELARELAEVAADEARTTSELSRQEMDLARERLDQRREQLIDAIENPPPKVEGDPKF